MMTVSVLSRRAAQEVKERVPAKNLKVNLINLDA